MALPRCKGVLCPAAPGRCFQEKPLAKDAPFPRKPQFQVAPRRPPTQREGFYNKPLHKTCQ
eukprot:2531026-Alexandrium_andersonii.AAC.1